MMYSREPSRSPTSPFGTGGLRGIPAAVAQGKHLESPLPPFAKGGNNPDANCLTKKHAEERP
jgi:hypothetical protein